MLTQVASHQKAAVRYIFDNGNEVSIVFGAGTYSDNHDKIFGIFHGGTFDEPDRYESTTCRLTHKFAKTGRYASREENGEDMCQVLIGNLD